MVEAIDTSWISIIKFHSPSSSIKTSLYIAHWILKNIQTYEKARIPYHTIPIACIVSL